MACKLPKPPSLILRMALGAGKWPIDGYLDKRRIPANALRSVACSPVQHSTSPDIAAAQGFSQLPKRRVYMNEAAWTAAFASLTAWWT